MHDDDDIRIIVGRKMQPKDMVALFVALASEMPPHILEEAMSELSDEDVDRLLSAVASDRDART